MELWRRYQCQYTHSKDSADRNQWHPYRAKHRYHITHRKMVSALAIHSYTTDSAALTGTRCAVGRTCAARCRPQCVGGSSTLNALSAHGCSCDGPTYLTVVYLLRGGQTIYTDQAAFSGLQARVLRYEVGNSGPAGWLSMTGRIRNDPLSLGKRTAVSGCAGQGTLMVLWKDEMERLFTRDLRMRYIFTSPGTGRRVGLTLSDGIQLWMKR